MNLQPTAQPNVADAWGLSNRNQGPVVIAVIGSQEDVFIQQSALSSESHRPVQQKDLLKITFPGKSG